MFLMIKPNRLHGGLGVVGKDNIVKLRVFSASMLSRSLGISSLIRWGGTQGGAGTGMRVENGTFRHGTWKMGLRQENSLLEEFRVQVSSGQGGGHVNKTITPVLMAGTPMLRSSGALISEGQWWHQRIP